MRLSLLLAAGLMCAGNAFAAYDASWYQTEFWSGEWPNGFSVAKRGVVVKGRLAVDADLDRVVKCELPYRAVFNPWNVKRNAKSRVHYLTASKIVIMKALKDFTLGDESVKADVKAGDEIEYLIYGAEGSFTVRYKGVEYYADMSIWDEGNVTPLPDDSTKEEQWVRLRCANHRTAWLYMPDLVTTDKDGNSQYIDGLWNASIGNPGVDGYGQARDLTDKEIRNGGN